MCFVVKAVQPVIILGLNWRFFQRRTVDHSSLKDAKAVAWVIKNKHTRLMQQK